MSLMRTVLGSLLFLVIAALVVWLVTSNDELETLKLEGLWGGQGLPNPFGAEPSEPLRLPIGLWYFIFTIFGILVGLFLGWFIAGQTRIRARQQTRRAKQAERALEDLRIKADKTKAELDDTQDANKRLENAMRGKSGLSVGDVSEVKQLTD